MICIPKGVLRPAWAPSSATLRLPLLPHSFVNSCLENSDVCSSPLPGFPLPSYRLGLGRPCACRGSTPRPALLRAAPAPLSLSVPGRPRQAAAAWSPSPRYSATVPSAPRGEGAAWLGKGGAQASSLCWGGLGSGARGGREPGGCEVGLGGVVGLGIMSAGRAAGLARAQSCSRPCPSFPLGEGQGRRAGAPAPRAPRAVPLPGRDAGASFCAPPRGCVPARRVHRTAE